MYLTAISIKQIYFGCSNNIMSI